MLIFEDIMIHSSKNKLFEGIFSLYLKRLLRKHFYKIQITGDENYAKLDKSLPTIIYANHSNWWDGFTAFYMAKEIWKIDSYLMMDIEQMRKYGFFKWLGAFSVERNSPRGAVEAIDYSVELLKNSNRFLWIFPQGELLPNDIRPLKFYNGITKISESLGKVNLLPFSMKYEFLGEQRAEVFLKIGEPDIFSSGSVNDSTNYLQEKLTRELDELREMIISGSLNNFRVIFYGKDSRNKTVDKIYHK